MRNQLSVLKLLCLLPSFLLFNLCSSAQAFLQGYLQGYNQPYIYVNVYQGNTILRDSAKVINDHFSLSFPISEVLAARLVTRDADKKIKDPGKKRTWPALQVLFFLTPGDTAFISGSYEEWPVAAIRGGKDNRLLSMFYAASKENVLQARKAMAESIMNRNQGDHIAAQRAEKKWKMLDSVYEAGLEQLQEKHPEGILAAHRLFESLAFEHTAATLQQQYEKLHPAIAAGLYGTAIRQRLKELQVSAEGVLAPSFSVQGKDSIVNSAHFRGRYVLLDFWGSWCVPCREGHPHLKALYDQYKNKGFEIISIAQEKSKNARESWLSAIQQDQLPWVHILNNEARFINGTDLIERFNVRSYPTKILLDPHGVVLLRSGYAFEALSEILSARLR